MQKERIIFNKFLKFIYHVYIYHFINQALNFYN